jgi:hypothetical protein
MSMTQCPDCTNEHTCHVGRMQAHPEMRGEIRQLLARAEQLLTLLEAADVQEVSEEAIWVGRIDAYTQALRILESSE